jgi:hypothetical protein
MVGKKMLNPTHSISLINTTQSSDSHPEQAFHPLSYSIDTPTQVSTQRGPTHSEAIIPTPHSYTIRA